MKVQDLFTITYAASGDKHLLTIAPKVSSEGYPPKTIEITAAQWDELKYHFMTGNNDSTGVKKLAYIG